MFFPPLPLNRDKFIKDTIVDHQQKGCVPPDCLGGRKNLPMHCRSPCNASGPRINALYWSRYGSKLIPPWKNTSMLGQTSVRYSLPVFCNTALISTSIHEGTPDRLFTSVFQVLSTIALILLSHSSIRMIFLSGTRIRLTRGFRFCNRTAERSPQCAFRFKGEGLWLPPSINLCWRKNGCRDYSVDRWKRCRNRLCNDTLSEFRV